MKKQTPQTRVSRLTIGRLFNLGNYEHVRYELTVDIAEGKSASVALRNVMRLLRAANPKPPVQRYDYDHAKSILSDPNAWHKNVADPKERKQRIKEMVKEAKENIARYDLWAAQRKAAEAMLDNIGCAKAFKDAKLDWEDDDWDT